MPLLTCKEVAEMFNVCELTVHNWTKSGKIPHLKIGGVIRYVYEDVIAVAQEGGMTK